MCSEEYQVTCVDRSTNNNQSRGFVLPHSAIHEKMTNLSPNQHAIQITDLSVMINRCSLDSQLGGPNNIPWMLAVLI